MSGLSLLVGGGDPDPQYLVEKILIPDCVRPVPAGGGGDPDPQYLVEKILISDCVRPVPAGGGGDPVPQYLGKY